MIPQTFRITVIAAYCILAVFGMLYNALMADGERRNWIAGLVSLAVSLGVAVTLMVVAGFFWSIWLPGWAWLVLHLGAFACSGSSMIIGSRMRHAREKAQLSKSRQGHRTMRWPNNMRSLRDAAAEETLSALRSLGHLDPKPADAARLQRARASLIKAAALLQQAGAPVDLSTL